MAKASGCIIFLPGMMPGNLASLLETLQLKALVLVPATPSRPLPLALSQLLLPLLPSLLLPSKLKVDCYVDADFGGLFANRGRNQRCWINQ